ncbi:hypothetical protein [Roseomonas sp. KE2513]|uniref:hypothetical protein n=1 Tax=Roseomonas sp. KE2513 TaxID=2479202 RepID=UPI0018DF2437|nr:hypothetical protein [Roseomonas sp. KE2513]
MTAAASDLSRPLRGGGTAGVDGGAERPGPGDPARGLGLKGKVGRLRDRQPLAAEGIWRVSLEGEDYAGRLVRRSAEGDWQLLQIDDLTDAQLEAYEKAMQRNTSPTPPSLLPIPR